jgi:hypothetical protein
MLNQLLKITLFASFWLWIKPRWKGLVALAVFLLLVNMLHGEYLGYVELSGNAAFLPWSYLVKWLLLLAAAGVYMLVLLRADEPGSASERDTKRAMPGSGPASADDGFDFLREKKTLQSRADKLLEKQ